MYNLRKVFGTNISSARFIKINSQYKNIGYNIHLFWETTCLIVNQIMVDNFAFLFNCTLVGQASVSKVIPAKRRICGWEG